MYTPFSGLALLVVSAIKLFNISIHFFHNNIITCFNSFKITTYSHNCPK
uniref:Uncharacterized protein n=1 Tax=Siphoviridae sp. cttJO12 TaxID=2826492 RepID=A0A8S5R1P5_9CAUD|nr:MAG TPA: hypothetical protein [Siphoviridae sp. cttJO12]